MKRAAAILLLGLLLFNWVGYEIYTAVLQQYAHESMVAQLDRNNYSDADLISIKVHTNHLSSYVNTKDFQRVDGKIDIEGVQYNYVKRRFLQDSLELLCIPNKTATNLQSARNEFFKIVNDLQQPGQTKKSEKPNSVFKGFSAEYFAVVQYIPVPDLTLISLSATDRYMLRIPTVFLTRAEQPPDQV
ncbi:MAG TPA: hypothetical protein VGH64_13540 [Puia sp.]